MYKSKYVYKVSGKFYKTYVGTFGKLLLVKPLDHEPNQTAMNNIIFIY